MAAKKKKKTKRTAPTRLFKRASKAYVFGGITKYKLGSSDLDDALPGLLAY